jgi:putative redox protein
MVNIKGFISTEPYKVELTSLTGNKVVADEPVLLGGKNSGFSPKELLASSLAACTVITLKMYATRKEWMLERVDVEVELEFDNQKNATQIRRSIVVTGSLSDEQKQTLLSVANKCPLHKILMGTINIETNLK